MLRLFQDAALLLMLRLRLYLGVLGNLHVHVLHVACCIHAAIILHCIAYTVHVHVWESMELCCILGKPLYSV